MSLQPKQSLAFVTPANELMYGGAAGGGKSHLVRVKNANYAASVPGLVCYIFRKTYPELVDNHLQGPAGFFAMFQDELDSGWIKFNDKKMQFTFGNGSIIKLKSLQHTKDLTKLQGLEMHMFTLDEGTHFTEHEFRFLRSRVRMANVSIPASFRYAHKLPMTMITANPGGVGHNWVKQEFVDIVKPGTLVRMPKKEGGQLRQYIQALLKDNQILVKSDPMYEQKLMGLGDETLVRAMLNGDWDAVAGARFSGVWHRDVHVIEPFDIPQSWKIGISYDDGSAKPYSAGFYAISNGECAYTHKGSRINFAPGTYFRVGEIYGWNGKANQGCGEDVETIARRIKNFHLWERVNKSMCIADSAIFNDGRYRGANDSRCVADAFKGYGVPFKPCSKGAGSRVNGWRVMEQFLTNALPDPDDIDGRIPEKPAFYVFDNCTHFIRTFPTLPRDDSKPDDVDTDAEDHAADEARYFLNYRPEVVAYNQHSRVA